MCYANSPIALFTIWSCECISPYSIHSTDLLANK